MVKPVESGLTTYFGCYDDKYYEHSCDVANVADVVVRANPCLDDSIVEQAQSTRMTRSSEPASVVLGGSRSQPSLCLETTSMVNDTGPIFDICFPPGSPTSAVREQLQLRQWLNSWLPPSIRVSQWKMIDNWRIPRFVELTYPNCENPDDARLLVAWMTWLHLFDDEFDRPTISRDRDAAEALIAPYLYCISELRSGHAPRGSLSGDLLHMFVDLNERTVAPMSEIWRSRWFDDLYSYIRAYIIETANRASGTILTPEALLRLKRTCMAQRPAINLIERVATGELSPTVFSLVSPVIDIISDITGSVNDPVSLARERSRGDTHNMIISLTQHHMMTESEAIDHLMDFVRVRCHDMVEAMDVIPNDPLVGREREIVTMWLTICGQWIRGYHDWLLETRRYRLRASVSEALPAAEPVV